MPPSHERTPEESDRQADDWVTSAKSVGVSPFRSHERRRSVEHVTTYLIEAYVAGGEVADVRARARAVAAAMSSEGYVISYLRAVLVRADETCFHLFEATSADAVAELARRADIQYERIVEAEEYRAGSAERTASHASTSSREA